MGTTISKSDFLKFKDCESYFWFWKNLPSVLSDEKTDPFTERLKSQGYEVELFARHLYPDAVLVSGKLQEAADRTSLLMQECVRKFFQASFLADGLFASCDILIWNDFFGGWDIIEVKSSTDKERKKEDHLLDAAFQRIVAQRAGLRIVNVYLLELNKSFLKDGEIDLKDLFNRSEVTTECIELETEIEADIIHAKRLLDAAEPTECSCKYKGRSRHCRAFNHLYPNVPEYSIYDLRRIGNSKKVLERIVDNDIVHIENIPDDFQMSEKHHAQRWVHLTKETILEREKITEQFSQLKYPLYFLDYETLACGIPKFDTTYPYQQTVFQYSLHIMHADGQLEHKEFLHTDQSTPVHIFAERLREDIGDVGSVIVWNKTFEGTCHKDLAAVNPDLRAFLLGLNDRIFDLMDIFRRMEYLHDDFKGSYSIKNVLPVMCPELSYKTLGIQDGAQAVVEYEQLVFRQVPDNARQAIIDNLLAYCKLDTFAMVRIFQELQKLISIDE